MRRLEESETGRLVISAFVLVVVVCLVANALPDTVVTRPLGRPVASLFGVTGLDQGWGLFAPAGRPVTQALLAPLGRPAHQWCIAPPNGAISGLVLLKTPAGFGYHIQTCMVTRSGCQKVNLAPPALVGAQVASSVCGVNVPSA
jgi:hypothetical protein